MSGGTDPRKPKGRIAKQSEREARLAAELRANLARRKAQARSRRDGKADAASQDVAAAPGEEETRGD